jgi:hypothetical protein
MTQEEHLPSEATVYLGHLLGLWPGKEVPTYKVHVTVPKDTSSWSPEELTLLVEEGRRQLDRQSSDLECIRGRAQFLFTTALGLLIIVFADAKTIVTSNNLGPFALWCLAILLSILTLLGAASIITARKELGLIDAAKLTTTERPILPELAAAYGRCVRIGENTVATQVTVFRDAVLLLTLAGALFAGAWIWAVV